MTKNSRSHTETLIVENDAFTLRVTTTQRVTREQKKQRGRLRSEDADHTMNVEMDAGEVERYEISHTLKLVAGGNGGELTLQLTPEALALLRHTLSKIPVPQSYGAIFEPPGF